MTYLNDFQGRRVTATAIIVAAFGSASLNVWGAFQIFPSVLTGTIFAIVICACEVIAALSLRHIVTDHENNRFWKARLGALIFIMAVAGCVFSGKQAFHVLFLEADANHRALEIRADARQSEADVYHANMIAGLVDVSPSVAQARWEDKQERADEANLKKLKAQPPHQAIVVLLLALFETVKIGGLFALASPSTKGRTRAQLQSDKRRAKIAERKAQADYEARLAALDDADNVISIAS